MTCFCVTVRFFFCHWGKKNQAILYLLISASCVYKPYSVRLALTHFKQCRTAQGIDAQTAAWFHPRILASEVGSCRRASAGHFWVGGRGCLQTLTSVLVLKLVCVKGERSEDAPASLPLMLPCHLVLSPCRQIAYLSAFTIPVYFLPEFGFWFIVLVWGFRGITWPLGHIPHPDFLTCAWQSAEKLTGNNYSKPLCFYKKKWFFFLLGSHCAMLRS